MPPIPPSLFAAPGVVAHGAADGFDILPPWLLGGFDLFVGQAVPILRARGLFRITSLPSPKPKENM
ncbi:hypothetical protein ACFV80_27770 [Streptomyces sp. NPDC059862]|uniref:hypothetical protein n=1 Tax=Streptomyces sp. NPDC059862 TaxID=3346975 RepID=UPI0036655425